MLLNMRWVIPSLLALSALVTCQVDPEIPAELQECMENLAYKVHNDTLQTDALTTPDEIHIHCIQEFLWKTDKVNWADFNITEQEMNVVNKHLRSLMSHRRSRRQVGPGMIFPRTGFRIRREYRRLRVFERMAFHSAINAMKMSGQYNTYANLHQGIVTTSAHNGPNFLGWHRVYLAVFEESLRSFNPRVALPYWDSSMDFDMVNPADSLLWSPPFLGNGDGFVTTGPFRNWPTPVGQLTRNVGGGSRLISKEVIATIMTRCRTFEIVPPTAQPQFDLELAHGGPHIWVGGQMAGLNTAAHDPVFFLHHAFIDYIWELFRVRQAFFCGVNPEMDYPPTMGQHAAERPMDGLPPYRNIDGYRNYWTRFWYRYERSPTCSQFRPFCGSPYLRCDVMRGRCISRRRPSMAPGGAMAFGARGLTLSNSETRMRGAMEASTIRIGPTFRAPPSDGRSSDALMARGRFRRSVSTSNSTDTTLENDLNTASRFGPVFRAPPNDARPVSESGTDTVVSDAAVLFNSQVPNFDPFSAPMPLLPSVDFSIVNSSAVQSQAAATLMKKINDLSMKAFIPVRILYFRTQPSILQSSLFSQDNQIPANMSSAQQSPYPECKQHPSGNAKVTIQSNGINYMGIFSNNVEVDTRLQQSAVDTYIRINTPNNGLSQMMLSAFHECGLMCQPTCAIPETFPVRYTPCTGILSILQGDNTVLYGTSLEAAIDNMKRAAEQMSTRFGMNPRVTFQCTNADVSSWSQLPYGPVWTA